jgi:hypothetical protein
MQTVHLQPLRETPDQRVVWAQGCYEGNVLEAERISEARSIDIGPTHTELSVTLSYLPKS